jgi:glycolate oxidase
MVMSGMATEADPSKNLSNRTSLRAMNTFESELAEFLPPASCLLSNEAKKPYECDGLSAYTAIPRAVVIPENRQQLERVIRVCREHDVPLVSRGAGTGLSGGALPLEHGCLISMTKFDKILDVDLANLRATVEPGVRNLAISDAVSKHGLYYAPDPSSQIACTIGGNVAENSGGVHCLKYGLTVHNVARLKVLTSEGELLTLGSAALDAPGLDLLALFHGSEGLLGIIVEVTVKLLPRPDLAQVMLAGFQTVQSASKAVSDIIGSGIVPAGLEMMDKLAIEVAEAYCGAGYPLDVGALLLCEVDGTRSEVEEQIEMLTGIMAANTATYVRLSQNEKERLNLWAGRKSAFPAIGRIAPDYYCIDGTIPRKHLGFVLSEISNLSKRYDLRVANVFHAGDGNLHPLIAYDANDSEQLRRTEILGSRILSLCVEVGGTITGEHGVGVEKLNEMCIQFDPLSLTQMHEVRRACDPFNLLNPGKALPTLNRCAEFGAMRVSGGQLPHPHLERF